MNNQVPNGAHILGQPFTITEFTVPVNATMNCNCAIAHGGAPTVLKVVGGAPVTCPTCAKIYILTFQVQGNLQVAIGQPDTKVPS